MRIAQYLSESPWGDVTPENLQNGMGGRETAVVQLAEKWGEAGHEVITFAPVSEINHRVTANGGKITYLNPAGVVGGLSAFRPDLFLTWEEPRLAAMPDVQDSCGAIVMGMQVAHIIPDDIAAMALTKLDQVVCLSQYAKDVLVNDNSQYITQDKVSIIPNCVDISLFTQDNDKARVPTAIYSSSPDRGLQALVHAWPLVVKKLPDAQLNICYGVEGWFKNILFSHARDGMHAVEIRDFLGFDNDLVQSKNPSPGVNYHGKVGQAKIRQLMSESHCLAFPCETQSPTETGCITVVEALASHTHPVLGDSDCLKTEYGEVATFVDTPVDYQEYADKLIEGLQGNLPSQSQKMEYGYELASQRDWKNAAEMYVNLAHKLINNKKLANR